MVAVKLVPAKAGSRKLLARNNLFFFFLFFCLERGQKDAIISLKEIENDKAVNSCIGDCGGCRAG